MKYLGIDYGTKRIGLATAPSGSTMAFPHSVVPAGSDLVDRIVRLCKDESVDVIVLGLSLNLNGKENPIMKDIRPFGGALEAATGLPLIYMNEVLSSREAMHVQGDNAQNDASAAAIVLQSYLASVGKAGGDHEEEDV
jgi:putative holliday junction resolvase